MEVADVMMFFKSDEILLPREMRNTQMYYMIEYLQRMASMMLNTRLSDLAKTPECDYAQARVSIGDFFLAKTKGALTLDVIAKNENVVEAFAEAYREVLRADRTGFTVGEYERASSEFISQVDKIFNERKSRENESYSEEYVRLFVDNIPAPGIELEKQLFDQFAQMINVDMVNQYFQSLVQDDNRVLVAFLPKKKDSPNLQRTSSLKPSTISTTRNSRHTRTKSVPILSFPASLPPAAWCPPHITIPGMQPNTLSAMA